MWSSWLVTSCHILLPLLDEVKWYVANPFYQVQLIRIQLRVPEYGWTTQKLFHLMNFFVNGCRIKFKLTLFSLCFLDTSFPKHANLFHVILNWQYEQFCLVFIRMCSFLSRKWVLQIEPYLSILASPSHMWFHVLHINMIIVFNRKRLNY